MQQENSGERKDSLRAEDSAGQGIFERGLDGSGG